MSSVFIRTWGCTLNQSDSDAMRALLRNYPFAKSEEEADVVVLNTCTVKGATENKILNHLEKLAAHGKKVVVAGCLTANSGRIREITPEAPLVGAGSTSRICEAVEIALDGRHPVFFNEFGNKSGIAREMGAPIARVPIEEGCVSRCAFCQTKIARPLFFSYPPKEVVRMVEEAVRNGAREIQLTGMDTGAYGLDIKTDLAKLLRELCKIDGDFRIRLGMINPQHVKRLGPALVEAFGSGKMFKFLHIPVQSGSEKVCREMKRGHTVADFENAVKEFRTAYPDITIATDVIVAYPTESADDYAKTVELLERVRPDVVNLSRFTPRPGTEAKKLKQMKSETAKQRTREMHALIREIADGNAQKFLGREMEALVLEKGNRGQVKGRTDGYRQVVLKAGKALMGKRVTFIVEKATHSSLFGKIIREAGRL
ncbi:MAG: tRNA (N(6)-L-threonylcarbamoyladenosine(37)-C(2))-methylthiotransferase [Candidatus ainarchaeum sp.]|nr:tRNA (N(6)-L-threonylcarbamoyladenosine(37)-C(2))-methylthiotransferase [Candidatus ainarchaeum sp.]